MLGEIADLCMLIGLGLMLVALKLQLNEIERLISEEKGEKKEDA